MKNIKFRLQITLFYSVVIHYLLTFRSLFSFWFLVSELPPFPLFFFKEKITCLTVLSIKISYQNLPKTYDLYFVPKIRPTECFTKNIFSKKLNTRTVDAAFNSNIVMTLFSSQFIFPISVLCCNCSMT